MIRVEAPAKINLCLRVGGRRSDGFHRVVTVFVALGLADVLEIEPADATVVEGFEADTLVRGALDLLGETRRVRIEKRIPVAAGLGGGSSDAAAVLRALGVGREPNELYRMARELGSDVPFFLSGLEVAMGTGRGDRLAPLLELPRSFGVVLVPDPVGLSTAEVYARCTPNPYFAAEEGALVRGVHTARDADGIARLVANDLEAAALELRPELREPAGRAAGGRRAGRCCQRERPHRVRDLPRPGRRRAGGRRYPRRPRDGPR